MRYLDSARIERGRRYKSLAGGDRSKILPTSILLSRTEKNRRSEENRVAIWLDATDEALEVVANTG
jgi:uncharacterized protein (DUF934 family)